MAVMIADVVGRDGITKELAISLLLDGVTGLLAAQGAFALQLSPLLLDETHYALLSTRLRDVYGHGEAAVTAWCADLEGTGTVFAGALPEIGQACRDPNDDHVIATAIGANAGIIVTGDKDLLALGQFQGVRIITAREFLSELTAV